MAMRNTKALLSCALMTAAGLLDATPAMATFCTTPISGTIVVVSVPPGAPVGETGACPVKDPLSPTCASQGDWTGIKYQITGGQASDLVSTLVTVNNTVSPNSVTLFPSGSTFYPAVTGDPYTGLGKYSSHERAVKVKVNTDGTFWVLVKGNKQPLPTSIVQKRGYCPIKSTQILGLGLDLPEGCVSSCGNFAPTQTLTKTEIVKFKECEVEFTRSVVTGAVTGFSKTANSDPACSVKEGSVSDLEVKDGDTSLGNVSFGDGFVSSGEESCNTRFIGGRYYTVCN